MAFAAFIGLYDIPMVNCVSVFTVALDANDNCTPRRDPNIGTGILQFIVGGKPPCSRHSAVLWVSRCVTKCVVPYC